MSGNSLTLRFHTASGQLIGEPIDVDFDPMTNSPIVLLCYEPLTRAEERRVLSTLSALFPGRPLKFAPAAAATVTVIGPRVFNRYRIVGLGGQTSVVTGPEGSPIAGEEFRVWWIGVNPWSHCPIVVYLDPLPENIAYEERKELQQTMLFQLGERFARCVSGRNFPIANAAYGFARAVPVVSETVNRQRALVGAPAKTKRMPTATKGRRR
jgi:hypothetical protein